jgi:hypothetical protein
VLSATDRLAGSKHSRSAFIEATLHRYLQDWARADCDFRGLEILNLHADELNTEAEDVLRYRHFEDQQEPAMKAGGIYRVYRSERKAQLAQFVGSLSWSRLTELDRALKTALELE